MLYTREEILDAAMTIRHYLPVLIDSDAQGVDHSLSELIVLCIEGKEKEHLILDILNSREITKEWTSQFLNVVECMSEDLGFDPLPGISTLLAPKYVCPHGDYSWFRYDISEEIPVCKTHEMKLVLSINEG